MSGILTVPEAEEGAPEYIVTGNEWVTLPDIEPSQAAALSVNVLWEAALGLVEFRPRGRPLLRPRLRTARGEVELAWTAEVVDGWLPVLRSTAGPFTLETRYVAPPGFKGFVAVVTATRQAGAEPVDAASVAVGFEHAWAPPRAVRFTAQPLAAGYAVRVDPWTKAVRVEAQGAPALGIRPEGAGGEGGRLAWSPPWPETRATGVDRAVPWTDGEAHVETASVWWETRLRPGETCTLALYCGVNREGDGAALNAVDLARRGAEALWAAAARSAAEDAPGDLPAPVRRNLLFNLHASTGRCLDSEARIAVTSRSPRYYVAAAHWTRDTLLWSLPGLIRTRPSHAREVLLAVFQRHARHPGEHAQYLDGTVVYPGFELDQLAAFVVALDRYARETGDGTVAQEPAVREAWPRLSAAVAAAHDPDTGLYRTFLLPTDDPAPMPFVTYDNALLCVALEAAARHGWPLAPRPEMAAAALREAMERRLVVEGPFGPQWAGATDGERHALFDEPPGSLELLAHYGFCEADDATYRNTVRWIRSAHNPRAIEAGGAWETSCEHAPYRWVLGWANAMWAGAAAVRTLERRRSVDRGAWPDWLTEAAKAADAGLRAFLNAPMDGGLACETVGDDGRLRTGAAFATCAGFVAAAAMEWLRARERLPRPASPA